MKNEAIIFCLSYLNIPRTCQLIEKYGARNVLVISNIPNITKFISELYLEVTVILTKSSGLMPISLYQQKKFYKKMLKSIINKNIYFFFVAYGVMESYAIRILCRNNKIFYKRSVEINHLKSARSLKSLLFGYYLKFRLGVKFDRKIIDRNIIFTVSDDFIAHIGAKELVIPDNLSTVKNRIAEKYNLTNKKVLFCIGGIIESNFIDQDEYAKKNDALIEALCQNYGDNGISLKMHPRFNRLYSKEKSLEPIPNYIPGNLIIDYYDIVIGYSSAILFEAANAGKTVVSTLRYFTPLSENTQNKYIDYLQSNLIGENKIHYFSNIYDLKTFYG